MQLFCGSRQIFKCCLICAVFFSVIGATGEFFAQQKQPIDVRDLPLLPIGETIERNLNGGDSQFYLVKLKRGEVLRLEAQERDVNIALMLATPKLEPFGLSDFGIRYDRETVSFIAEVDTDVVVFINAWEGQEGGSFQFTATIKPTSNAQDKERIVAEKLQLEALESLKEGSANSLLLTLSKFEQASTIWHSLGEPYWEAYSLNLAGMAQVKLGREDQALVNLNRALPLWKAANAKRGEADTQGVLAGLYVKTGDYRKVLEALSRALLLVREVGDRQSEASYLENISMVYEALGEKEKSAVYSFAAKLRLNSDDRNMATMIGETGVFQKEFGNFPFALAAYDLALAYAQSAKDKAIEAQLLGDLTSVYLKLEQLSQAMGKADLKLRLCQELRDKQCVAAAYADLSEISLKSGERQKALDYANRVLPLINSIKNEIDKGMILRTVGYVYNASGDHQKALQYLNPALLLSVRSGIYLAEAEILQNMMLAWKALRNRRLAVFYGKQAVNIYQRERVSFKKFDQSENPTFFSLDKSAQKMFLKSSESAYKQLAELLIENERLQEAQEVLSALKNQQLLDFDVTARLQPAPLSATARETVFNERYQGTRAQVSEMRQRLQNYKDKGKELGEQDASQVKRLENELEAAVGEFASGLKQTEADFGQPASDKDRLAEVAGVRELRMTLRVLDAETRQKVVGIFTLVGEDKYCALVITADSITSVSQPVEGRSLNEKAFRLWALLQTDAYDPTKVSQDLYSLVFKPLEAKLPRDAKTILWSLDGNLRYVPMAALFDGKRYLVERYNHVVFTRAERERLTRAVSPRWTGIGFGGSQAQTIELPDETISFGALEGVTKELDDIFLTKNTPNGIIEGGILLDSKFTEDAFLAALKQKRPLVHIASHFSFRPGDELRSFLVLGDGSTLTLSEMKQVPDLFAGVELLTLSACNTAAQQVGANGREIDGFGELAQRLGAGSVLASLWPVADMSTPYLMRDFYRLKETGAASLTKAEALREAQLALLRGTSAVKSSGTKLRANLSPVKIVLARSPKEKKLQVSSTMRSDLVYFDEQDAPPYQRNDAKPFAHPYYWSPFILFGNWR